MLVLVLFGCDRTTRVEEPWPPQKSGEREEVPAAPTPQESAGHSAPDEAVSPELDLTVPAEVGEQAAPEWTMSEHRRLPDLFASDDSGRKAARRLSIGARLLLEEDEPDYREAVEGGEIHVKLKTP